jgi:putative transposase
MMYPVVRELSADGTPVATACRVLQVSTSGFYEWNTRGPSQRDLEQAYLMNDIHDAHKASYGIYGHRRIHAELVLGKHRAVSPGRVQRLMKCTGLQGITRRRLHGCTRRDEAAVPSDDLVNRQFTAAAPDRLYVADITQHRADQGWFYLAVVLDVFSRRVVGWAMADHLRAELVVDALQMAIWQRRPGPGAIHHSDHGSQTGLNRWTQHRLVEATVVGRRALRRVSSNQGLFVADCSELRRRLRSPRRSSERGRCPSGSTAAAARWTLLCLSSGGGRLGRSDCRFDSSVEASGQRAFERASDVAVGLAFGAAPDLIVARLGMTSHPGDGDGV